ncbi:MAG: 4-alpha-glucanotransferase, partial [Clostridiales bacterium]|nr:4-alpha-glucanotransferase [Clostridiales bacterium]
AEARRDTPDRVDYDGLRAARMDLFRKAWRRSGRQASLPEACPQLEDYVQFAALAGEDPGFHRFLQALFFQQWFALKRYANDRGVRIIGDLPFYVSPDSTEVRSTPSLFQLDGRGQPQRVAGVPPDAFSAVGQLWGNPLYDWSGQREALFQWWSQRLAWAARLYDVVRIDHFRGIHTYWSIPAGAADAREGRWERGPGTALLDHLARAVPDLPVIAEDLGDLDEAALTFVRESGLPGMRVLVYAFDPVGESAYLPHNCPSDAVMYTGTHDTPTFVQWLFEEAMPAERGYCLEYLRLSKEEGFGWGAIRGAWSSPCRLAIAPLQDVLGLGADARTNTPGTVGPANWSWRVRREALNQSVADRLRHISRIYRRG